MVGGGHRAVARCDALGQGSYSDAPDMLFRPYLGRAHAAALDALTGWMEEAGMAVRLDALANLIGRYEAVTPGAPALLIGSHIDSVRDAGRYDGPLGILLGIEAIAALNGKRLPFAIEVIAFGDEEGSRFPASMLCSRAVAGVLDPAALDIADGEGVTFTQARASFSPSPHGGEDRGEGSRAAGERPTSTAEHPHPTLSLKGEGYTVPPIAFLEAHIEQGPVLEAEGLALGTVTGIAAQLRFQATVGGVAGHAGTTAMGLRKDALAAAAEMVLAIERIAGEGASGLVATVGRLSVAPGAVNVVPGRVDFSIDVRSGDPAMRDDAARRIAAALSTIAETRGVTLDMREVQDLPASPCDPALMELMDAAIASIGQPVRRLVSGAGHDAMVMAALCPIAMLFIRCAGGISHNPAESVDPADADLALRAMLAFIQRLGAQYG